MLRRKLPVILTRKWTLGVRISQMSEGAFYESVDQVLELGFSARFFFSLEARAVTSKYRFCNSPEASFTLARPACRSKFIRLHCFCQHNTLSAARRYYDPGAVIWRFSGGIGWKGCPPGYPLMTPWISCDSISVTRPDPTSPKN